MVANFTYLYETVILENYLAVGKTNDLILNGIICVRYLKSFNYVQTNDYY